MIEVGFMRPCHVAAVAELEVCCFSDPWSERSITAELENPLSLWLVATDGERVLGYVGSQSVLGEADMMNLAVAPEFRRQGIGNLLVEQLVQKLKEQGVHILCLEVRESNMSARRLYEKLGFVQVGRRPNYYTKPKEAALILRKEWAI